MMFCSPEFGTTGPILGTIHASKGREAPTVYLYLQERPSSDESGEEAKVMFVGATRPRERLLVGSAGPHHGWGTHKDGRAWRKGKNCVQIEVGRVGDIDPSNLVGRPFFSRQDEALAAQLAWWAHPRREGMNAKGEEALGWQFSLNGGGLRLGGLSHDFRWAVNQIGYGLQRRINWLGHLRSLGLRTMAVASDSAQLETMLEPWKSSGFLFAPLIYSLSYVKLR